VVHCGGVYIYTRPQKSLLCFTEVARKRGGRKQRNTGMPPHLYKGILHRGRSTQCHVERTRSEAVSVLCVVINAQGYQTRHACAKKKRSKTRHVSTPIQGTPSEGQWYSVVGIVLQGCSSAAWCSTHRIVKLVTRATFLLGQLKSFGCLHHRIGSEQL
jgi:hypothetical protein